MAKFEELFRIDVSDHVEVKDTGKTKLSYLSWAWAWAEVKKRCPDAQYKIKTFDNLPYVYDDKTGYMVYTSVTIDGITHDMWLPVMDGANRAMFAEPRSYKVKNPNFRYATKQPDGTYKDRYGNVQEEYLEKTIEAATMMDINKALMRCLTKNLSMFGLGLYIYAGEDLPEAPDDAEKPAAKTAKKTVKEPTPVPARDPYEEFNCYNLPSSQTRPAKPEPTLPPMPPIPPMPPKTFHVDLPEMPDPEHAGDIVTDNDIDNIYAVCGSVDVKPAQVEAKIGKKMKDFTLTDKYNALAALHAQAEALNRKALRASTITS